MVETTEPRELNADAGAYMEDDPEAWAHWIDALERYVPRLPALAKHIGEEAGAFQVIGGSILAYLADRRGLYLTRAATLRSTSRDSEDWKWLAVERGRSIRMYVSMLENYGKHAPSCPCGNTTDGCSCGLGLYLARARSFVQSMDAAPDVPEAEYVAHRTAIEVAFARDYPDEAEIGSCSVCGGVNGKHGPVCPVAAELGASE